jgi:hypothetical protein
VTVDGTVRDRGQGPRSPWPFGPFPAARSSTILGPTGDLEEDDVHEAEQWTVTIDIDEHEGRTRAVARLRTRDTERLVGVGLARLDPADRDVPEIGDEIAVARALSDLSQRLLHTAAEDVEQSTGERARLHV